MRSISTTKKLTWDMPILAFDLETTTSVKAEADIVQLGMAVQAGPDKPVRVKSTLVATTMPIHPKAQEVHGISWEDAQAGISTEEAIRSFLKALDWIAERDGIAVAYSMPFDWTILTTRARLRQIRPDPLVYTSAVALYDPLVVDRHIDTYRKGSRKMDRLLEIYDLKGDITSSADAHDAGWDAEAALLITREQIASSDELQGLELNRVTPAMRAWHYEWADNYERYLREKRGDTEAFIPRDWPYVPYDPRYHAEKEPDPQDAPFVPTGTVNRNA